MPRRMQLVSCWHLDLFIFSMLSIQQEQLNGTGGLGEYEAVHTRAATRVKARLTWDSYLFNFFFREPSLFLHRALFNFYTSRASPLACLSLFSVCEVFTLKRLHTNRLNKIGTLHVSQEGSVQTALLLLSENKDFFPACRGLLGQKQINRMCDVKASNAIKKNCLIDFAAIMAFGIQFLMHCFRISLLEF